MPLLPLTRTFLAFSISGALAGVPAATPARAAAAGPCDSPKASAAIFSAAGDRYRARGRFLDAAQSYLAAARSARSCPRAGSALLESRALAQAGIARALSGDYLDALTLLHTAQQRLNANLSGDAQTATAARSDADVIQNVISLIDRIAQSSM